MRSRYTAHVTNQISYIRDTLAPESQKNFDEKAVREWAAKSEWMGLKILNVEKGKESDSSGVVEFVATYKTKGKVTEHHEVSQFRQKNERWFFVDGESHVHEDGRGHHHHVPIAQVIREEPKIGRNDPCPCGSGQKYKKCHGK